MFSWLFFLFFFLFSLVLLFSISFCLTFSFSMKLTETPIYIDFGRVKSFLVFCVSLYSLCMPKGFGGRPWSEMSMSQVPPQGIMAVITLVGARAGDRGDKARARCESKVLLHSDQYCLIEGRDWSPGAGEKALRVKSDLVPFFSICYLPPPRISTFTP